jgi:hypothetical protein
MMAWFLMGHLSQAVHWLPSPLGLQKCASVPKASDALLFHLLAYRRRGARPQV